MDNADFVSQIIGEHAYISAVTFLLTVVVPVAMVARIAPHRDKFLLRSALCFVALIAFSELFTLAIELLLRNFDALLGHVTWLMPLKFFCLFLLSGVAVKICFECNWWGALFCATAGYCLQHIQARIGSIILDFLIKNLPWGARMAFNLSFAAIFYALFYIIFFRKRENGAPFTVNNLQVLIAACVVGVNIFYNSFGISYVSTLSADMQAAGLDTVYADKLRIFIYIMSMLVAALALALDFGMSINKRLSDEKAALNTILEEGKRQYEYEKKNIEMINLKCHDLKHQLGAMKGKIYEEQIDELNNVIEIYDSSVKTGNEALDVVLTQKSLYCSQHGIRLTCLINGENYNFIARHELYSLFTNMIDNAIEAVEKLPEGKRVISITERTVKGFLTLCAENYYLGEIELEGGLPVSAKDASEHGFGVKSMKLIAEKYDGGITVNVDGDKFMLNIYFLPPRKS